jgi:hypothetical protein
MHASEVRRCRVPTRCLSTWLFLLAIVDSGCASFPDTAPLVDERAADIVRNVMSREHYCPVERVVIRGHRVVFQPKPSPVLASWPEPMPVPPPPEIASDPARLQLWRDAREREQRARDQALPPPARPFSYTVIEGEGCSLRVFYTCHGGHGWRHWWPYYACTEANNEDLRRLGLPRTQPTPRPAW